MVSLSGSIDYILQVCQRLADGIKLHLYVFVP